MSVQVSSIIPYHVFLKSAWEQCDKRDVTYMNASSQGESVVGRVRSSSSNLARNIYAHSILSIYLDILIPVLDNPKWCGVLIASIACVYGSFVLRQSIMEHNGGSVIAMAGKDCVAIASDLRLGAGAMTVALNFEKVSRSSSPSRATSHL